MDPMEVHSPLASINTHISAHVAQLRRASGPRSNATIHAWESVFDMLNAAQSVLMMLELMRIDADDPDPIDPA